MSPEADSAKNLDINLSALFSEFIDHTISCVLKASGKKKPGLHWRNVRVDSGKRNELLRELIDKDAHKHIFFCLLFMHLKIYIQ